MLDPALPPMPDKEHQRLQFIHSIISTLEENPAWLNDALNAISVGMNKALQKARERSAQYDLAFRLALTLADPKRLNQSTKDLINQKISEVIGTEGMCGAERDFLERASPNSCEGER